MIYNTINQKENLYNSNDDFVKNNIVTGRMIYEHPLLSIGQGNFKIDLSLCYNSQNVSRYFPDRKIGFGNGWKFNFEQQVFPYKSEYNLEGFNVGDYVYIDNYWNIYRFIEYKINDDVKTYVDSLGLGYFLTNYNNSFYSLGDNTKNYIVFDNNGYISRFSSNGHPNTYKEIIVSESLNVFDGYILKIYDNRSPDKSINISYSNDLPISVNYSESPSQYLIKYNSENQICSLIKYHSGKYYDLKKYYYENKLKYVVDVTSNQGFKFNYVYKLGIGLYQLQSINIGTFRKYVSKSKTVNKKYISNNEYLCDDQYVSNEKQIVDVSYDMLNAYVKSNVSYLYYEGYTEEIGTTGIKIVYFYDDKGLIIGILEKDNSGNYYELQKGKYWQILDNKSSYSTVINNQHDRLIETGILSITKENETLFQEFIDKFKREPETQYSYIEDFYLKFWLKSEKPIYNNPDVKLNIISEDSSITEKCYLNNTFSNIWQKVLIPFKIKSGVENINQIVLDFTKISNQNNIVISDVSIMIGTIPKTYVENCCFNDSQEIIYKCIDKQTNEEIKYIVSKSNDFYLTNNDLLKTMKNLYLSKYKNENHFDLIYCNSQKIKSITELGFVCDGEEKYFNYSNKFNFDIISKERMSSELWLINVLNYNYDYDEQMFEHYLINETYVQNIHQDYEVLNKVTAEKLVTESYLNGLIKSKIDNYGVKTIYEYDSYWNLLSIKAIDTKQENINMSTVIEYEYENLVEKYRTVPKLVKQNGIEVENSYDPIYHTLTSKKIGNLITTYNYVQPLNNLSKISFYGQDDNPQNIINLCYDGFCNLKNIHDYSFEYGFSYDYLNECTQVYKNKECVKQVVNKDKYSICTNNKKNTNEIIKDKYGNISKIINNNKVTVYKYQYDDLGVTNDQNNSEEQQTFNYSPMCGELVKIINENNSYEILRDNDGNTIGFLYKDLITNNLSEITYYGNVERQHTLIKEYMDNFNSYYLKEYKTDKDGLNMPNKRITELTFKKESDTRFNVKYNYEYDNLLTTIKRKNHSESINTSYVRNFNNGCLSSTSYGTILSLDNNENYDQSNLTETLHYDTINKNGNIVKITKNGSEFRFNESHNSLSALKHNIDSYVMYTYDDYNRLIQEKTNLNDIKNYEYDSCGNLLKVSSNDNVKEFENTLDHCNSVTINGIKKNILYDQYGNIIKYGDVEYTYNNLNQLITTKYIKDNCEMVCDYYYDYNGRRNRKVISRISNNIKNEIYDYYYYYNGNQLMAMYRYNHETNSTIYFHYFYDNFGLCGLDHNGNYYGIILDSLGNVSKIVDYDRVIIDYSYDAYGNFTCELVTGENDYNNIFYSAIKELNVFTYRGYQYDEETRLFIMGQKYYSPELCRFIQPADVSSLNPHSINGLNLYAFANNNPIGSANVGMLSGFSAITMLPSYKLPITNPNVGSRNYWYPHVKGKWFVTDVPEFFNFTHDKIEFVNWSFSVYKCSLYFDHNENHSLYIAGGNISTYLGIGSEGVGLDLGANVLEIGYDGRIIDANVEFLTIGLSFMYKDGTFELGVGAGWFGYSVKIDIDEIIKIFFGG